jgi:hypothetical protein
VFSFFPAMVLGAIYARSYRHRVALFVWVVPIVILAYKFFTFPTTVFENHFAAALHQYLSGGFLIPEFHSYGDLFRLVGTNSDMARGMRQLTYTAPAYAAIGYSAGTWVSMHLSKSQKPTV